MAAGEKLLDAASRGSNDHRVRRTPNTTHTVFAGYNRIAANDVLMHWTPPLPIVLP